MTKMKADWIQEGGFKDVTVTLKVLKHERDYEVSFYLICLLYLLIIDNILLLSFLF